MFRKLHWNWKCSNWKLFKAWKVHFHVTQKIRNSWTDVLFTTIWSSSQHNDGKFNFVTIRCSWYTNFWCHCITRKKKKVFCFLSSDRLSCKHHWRFLDDFVYFEQQQKHKICLSTSINNKKFIYLRRFSRASTQRSNKKENDSVIFKETFNLNLWGMRMRVDEHWTAMLNKGGNRWLI